MKQDTCENNPHRSFNDQKALHLPSEYALNHIFFDESNITKYTGKDCLKKLAIDLKKQVMKIINTPQKRMILLTDEEKLKHFDEEKCHICHDEFISNPEHRSKYKLFKKVRDHCPYTGKYRGAAAHSICNLRYKAQRDIPVIIHNGSNYDFHPLIKDFAKYFKGSIECIGENTEKYISFSITIIKEYKEYICNFNR